MLRWGGIGDGVRDMSLPGNVWQLPWQSGKCCQDRSPTPPPLAAAIISPRPLAVQSPSWNHPSEEIPRGGFDMSVAGNYHFKLTKLFFPDFSIFFIQHDYLLKRIED